MGIKITIQQLEILLCEQKLIVIEKLLSGTGYFNTESDASSYRTIDTIDKQKFKETGMDARFPDDLITLKKYLK